MKVCLISNLYPPYNRGGAEQVVKNTVEGLISRGHEVVVITARPWGVKNLSARQCQTMASGEYRILNNEVNQDLKIQNSKFQIHRFFPLNLFFYGNDYKYPAWIRFFWHILDVFNLHSYIVVRQILKKEKPDVVHTHNLKGLGYLIPLAIRQLKLFHVHTLHDVQLVEPSGIILKQEENTWAKKSFWRAGYEKICRRLFGSPQVVISPSKFLLDFYEKRGFFPKSQKVVVPNPVTEVKMVITESDRVNEAINFLYVGQVEEHKGILFLIETFKKLISLSSRAQSRDLEIPPLVPTGELELGRNDKQESGMTKKNIFLHIVGSGSKLEEAKRSAKDFSQIIFYGKLDRGELPQIFAKSDITIVPSLCYENSPTVIFESFSYGVPVLASAIEGVAELIKDDANGLTFVAGNQDSLLNKLQWCLEHQDQIRQMRQVAKQAVLGRGLEPYLDKLLNLCYNR